MSVACRDNFRAPAITVTVRNTFISVKELESPVSRKRSSSWDGPCRSRSSSNTGSTGKPEWSDDSDGDENLLMFGSMEASSASNDSTDDERCSWMPVSRPTPTPASWTTAYGSTDKFGKQADRYPLPTLLSQTVTTAPKQPTVIPCAKLGVLSSAHSEISANCDTVTKKVSFMLNQATSTVSTPLVPYAGREVLDTLSEKLKVACQELPSLGSIAHQRGTCKPCAFGANCRNGAACEFCHLCVAPQKTKGGRWILKRRKKTLELHDDLLKSHAGKKCGKKFLHTSRQDNEAGL